MKNSASIENITADEKACHNLVFRFGGWSKRFVEEGEGWNNTAAFSQIAPRVREALMAIDNLKAEQGIVQTDIDSVVGKKLINFIDCTGDDTLQKN